MILGVSEDDLVNKRKGSGFPQGLPFNGDIPVRHATLDPLTFSRTLMLMPYLL